MPTHRHATTPTARIMARVSIAAVVIGAYPGAIAQQPSPPTDDDQANPARAEPAQGHQADASGNERPPLLLVDPETQPAVRVTWSRSVPDAESPEPIEHAGTRAYGVDTDRTPLGGNISCYAAAGGVRLTKGAGHPRGAIVRVGFYKIDNARPFFEGVSADTEITVTMTGVRFNQPVDPNPGSLIQHLKYDRGEMQLCGLPGDAREQFNIADPRDTLNDRVRPGVDARIGAFDPEAGRFGTASIDEAEDGSITMTLTFRYPALRNLRDPWKSDLPGTFLEPYHFHFEFEVLPEGVAPLDPTRERVEHIDGTSN